MNPAKTNPASLSEPITGFTREPYFQYRRKMGSVLRPADKIFVTTTFRRGDEIEKHHVTLEMVQQ